MDEKARLVIFWRLAPPSSKEAPNEQNSHEKDSYEKDSSPLNLDWEEELAWRRYRRNLEVQQTLSPTGYDFIGGSIDHSDESNRMTI